MFEEAIEKAQHYIRPVIYITRTYGTKTVSSGVETLFFVNDKACAVTSRHAAQLFINAEKINQKYQSFRAERDAALLKDPFHKQNILKELEEKYDYKPGTLINVKVRYLGAFTNIAGITFHLHPQVDLAILQFLDPEGKQYDGHAVFTDEKGTMKQGRELCRMGFPFSEAVNYRYNEQTDDIEWTNVQPVVSSFPTEGIITRNIANEHGEITGIEMSTPGFSGQCGGPLFDAEGNVYGMQSGAKPLPMGYEFPTEVNLPGGEKRVVGNRPVTYVGQCVHADVIKAFLHENHKRFSTFGVSGGPRLLEEDE